MDDNLTLCPATALMLSLFKGVRAVFTGTGRPQCRKGIYPDPIPHIAVNSQKFRCLSE